MSYSNYSLNNRVSYLEYEIGQLAPIPVGGYVPVNGNSTINNVKTFSTCPKTAIAPVANDDICNKLYVDGAVGVVPTLQQVVNSNNGISNFVGGSTATINSTNFTNGRQLQLNADATPTIKMIDNANASHFTTFDIDTINLNGTSTNWSSIVAGGTTPTIDQVLNAGSTSIAKQQIFTSGIDQIQVAIDNTQIFLEDQVVGGSAILARQQLYIESPITTTMSHTEINQTSLICNTHDNILGGDNTTTLQGTSILMLATQPTLFTSQQLQITPTDVYLTINGGVPSTATWANILAGGGATPNIQQVLTQGNDCGNQAINNINQLTMSDGATYLSSIGALGFNNNNGQIN
jgi:hypothetical protein